MTREVTITDEHVKMVRRLNWAIPYQSISPRMDYDQSLQSTLPIPYVDRARPFGSVDWPMSIASILDWELFDDAHGKKHLSKFQFEDCRQLMRSLCAVVEVMISDSWCGPGVYACKGSRSWIYCGAAEEVLNPPF